MATVAVCTIGAVATAAPAWAADGVDLRVSVPEVTFGAGSVIGLRPLRVENAGTAAAADVVATIDLVSDAATPALTFTAQRAGTGCTLVSASRLTCQLADVAAAGTLTSEVFASAVEAHPVPGTPNPTPMSMRVKVTVSASAADLVPSDNTVVSAPILRTVVSGATDWVAGAQSVRGKVGDTVTVQLGTLNRGPATIATGETVSTYVAPAGTEWATRFISNCVEVRPKAEFRCTSVGFNPPESGPISFTQRMPLKILQRVVGDGQYRIEGMGGELKPADNVAKIVVEVEGAPPPPTTAPAAPTLPTTGTRTMPVVTTGSVLLAVGALLLLLARRRRATDRTSSDQP
jgi:LPXTG-motif cell wall-anchored protein